MSLESEAVALLAGGALSNRVVRVDATSCPRDAVDQIDVCGATHAVVFEGEQIRGLVRIAEAIHHFPERSFVELLQSSAAAVFSSDTALEDVVRFFAERGIDAAIVVDKQESFVGVVTSQSLLAAMASQRSTLALKQQQLMDQHERLFQMGRTNIIGEIASGLSHELNQPLTAIVAYVDACQELVESGRMSNQQLADVLRSVSGQAERAGQIIHCLRKMIKRSQPDRSLRCINEAVREVAALTGSLARQAGVAVKLELDEKLPVVPVDFLQIQQVVLQLMYNGFDALQNVSLPLRRLTVSTRRPSEFEIEAAVCDEGCGLTDESAERLFESFFSTKVDGMGLGLSISRSIVEAHGGRIWVTPNSERGVSARFTLPISPGKAAHVRGSYRLHR